MRIIEICNNNEWLEVFGPLDGCDPIDEAAADWWHKLSDAIESEFPDVETQIPSGQRVLLHGWNGVNTFARKFSGIGTFDEFTDSEWDRITEIVCEVGQSICDEYTSSGEEA